MNVVLGKIQVIFVVSLEETEKLYTDGSACKGSQTNLLPACMANDTECYGG